MKIKKQVFLAALLVSIGLVVTNATSGVDMTSKTYYDEEIVSVLVYLKDYVDLDSITNQMDRQRASLRDRHETVVVSLQNKASESQPQLVEYLTELQNQDIVKEFQCFWIGNIIRVDTYQSVVDKIARRNDVLKVYPNYEIELIAPVEENIESDPIYRNDIEPGIEAIRADEVWDLGITGEGVLVATLDTGVDGDHPALADRWAGVADPRYEGHPEWAWLDTYGGQNDFPFAYTSHGTHTQGTVCGGEPGDQIGVAPGALWIAAGWNWDDDVEHFSSDCIEAFEWMIDPDGDPETNWDVPAACSNSWGLSDAFGVPDCNETFWSYLDACEAAGIVIIFSAGNEGSQGLRRPADRATDDYRCFAVAAVDGNNPDWPIAGFSSRGPTYCTPNGDEAIKPDIAAPGVSVRSSVPDGGYSEFSGTSMASPHINGVVAFMREVSPNISVESIKEIIFQTAYDLGDPDEDNDYGWGMVDAYEAVILLISLLPSPPTIEGPINGIEGESLNFTLNSTDPEGDDVYYFVDWDDGSSGEWIGPYLSGEEVTVSHIWDNPETYEIRAKVMNTHYYESDWSEPHIISIAGNQKPTKVTINGPVWGWGGTEYEFNFVSTDPDGHDLYYRVNWDDGDIEDWFGPYSSGETFTLSHSWKEKGNYWIKAWAKDTVGYESPQASFKINILTNANKEKTMHRLLTEIIDRLAERYPLMNKIFQDIY
jgi:subtilisin family serine protease